MSRREQFSVGTLTVGNGTELKLIKEYSASLTPAAITAADVAEEQQFTITGVKAGDHVIAFTPPASMTALVVAQCRVTADDTVKIKFHAHTTATPTAGTYTVVVARKA